MINKDFFQKVLSLLMMGVMLTLGLKIGYNNIFTIAFFLLSVIYSVIYRPKINFRNTAFWFFIAWFLLNGFSAILSHDQEEAWHKMELRLMFLLIPYPILILSTFKNSIKKHLSVFVYGMAFFTSILLIYNLFKFIQNSSCTFCFFHDFTALYRQHAVYYSILLLIAGVIMLEAKFAYFQQVNSLKLDYDLILTLGFLIIFSLGLLFAASKIILVLWGIYLVYYTGFKLKNKSLKIAIALLFVVGLSVFAISDNIRFRFTEGLDITQTDYHLEDRIFSYDEKVNISDMELRFLLAKIGLKHIKEDKKILTGYGLGDQQNWFDYHLMRYNLAPNWYYGHNVHNQYLDILLTFGIFGLALFVVFLVYILYLAWKNKHDLSFIVFLIFILAFLFEVYLGRNKGIVFFTFWTMLFYTFYLNNKAVTNEEFSKNERIN